MAIIKTYPLKNNYYGPDRLVLSDMQPDDQGVVHGTTKSLTLSSLKSFLGANAVLNLTTEGTSGASTYDANTNTLNVPVYEGDTYNLIASPKISKSVPLKLNAASGTDSEVSFTEGTNVTLTRNSETEIIISATGGNAGVSSVTNAFGTYITGTANTAATGAVDLGTINLNAVDGTSIAATRFLSKDNTWDVISASGSNTQFQYNNSGAFAGTPLMVITGNDEIQIGQQTNEQGKLIVSGQAAGTSGLIKIEGKSARGVTFSVQPETNVNYDVVFPDTGPGGNNKILESDSSGNLAWISTPTGINVVGNPSGTASADLSKITIGSTIYAIPTQGLTSVGLSAPPAFSVTGSPLTSNGSISIGVTGGSSGEFLAYNGQWATPTDTNSTYSLGTGASPGQIILTGSNPTTTQTVTVAGTNGMSITQFTTGTFNVDLGLATSSTRGGVKIGFAESGKNYPVELSSEKMFVNVPWTDTNTTNITLTTSGTSGAATWNGTTLNIPQYSSGSGGGISFSGTTSGGLATYTNSSTAGVSSKVTLNANGLMDFDADGNSAGSIDYDATGTRLKIGDLSSGNSGIVEIFTNGNRQFQIGVNGEIGLGTGGAQGTSGQVLTSAGNGSPATWSSAGGNVPANNVTGAGNTYEIPMWNNPGGGSGSFIGAGNGFNSSPFKSNSSGQSIVSTEINGGITFRKGTGAQVKIEGGSASGTAYQINLPPLSGASIGKVLGVSGVSSNIISTSWQTASGGSSKLGFSPASIYQATHGISSDTTGRTVWRASVVETDCTIDKVDFFVTAVIGEEDLFLTVAVYVGSITSANRVLIGTSSALATGVNTITFATSYTFSAGDNIVIYTSQSGGGLSTSTIAGVTVLNSTLLCRQSLSYSSTPASSIAPAEGGGDRVLSLHFYDE